MVPIIEYTDEENKLWQYAYDEITPSHEKYATEELKYKMTKLSKLGYFSRDRIPQHRDFNQYLSKTTKMFLKPIGGLLAGREFLYHLAFRVFPSTQYIRHGSEPLFTPEPDVIHEYLGHVMMLFNEEFAQFSQQIGLASLGASDEIIEKLQKIYWYSIETGIAKEKDEIKLYGATVLSSVSEMKNALEGENKRIPFDLEEMTKHEINYTKLQDVYFTSPSFNEMKNQVEKYIKTLNKDYHFSFDNHTNKIKVNNI